MDSNPTYGQSKLIKAIPCVRNYLLLQKYLENKILSHGKIKE